MNRCCLKNIFNNNSGLSLWFCLILFCFIIISPCRSMIKDVSLSELVKKSDIIAIVDVLAVKTVGTLPSGNQVIANLIKVDQPLFGNVAVGEKLKIKTRSREDNADLKVGQRTILFLKKVDNYYEVVYGIAGSWPINQDGVISGYGRGNKLSDIEKAIESAKEDKNKKALPQKQNSKKIYKISI